MTAVTYIENETELDNLIKDPSLVVVDCTATWCGPCKVVAPLMDQLAEEYSGKAKVFKLDLDSNKDLAKRFGIRSIPAVMFFQESDLKETIVGVQPYEKFSETAAKYVE